MLIEFSEALEQILPNAIAGLIAGIVAPSIFGFWRFVRNRCALPKEINLLRNVILQKRNYILSPNLDVKEDSQIDSKNLKDTHRAGLYNGLLTEIDVCLSNWTPNLPSEKKREIYESVDWFNTSRAVAQSSDWPGKYEIVHTGAGKWHSEFMEKTDAEVMFEKLESIEWLKLTPRKNEIL